jgi:hypothetical protein
MTESGKTSLAVLSSRNYRERGVSRIILDPLSDPRWEIDPECEWIGSDPEEFTRIWKLNKQCALYVDESGRSIGKYAGEMQEVVTLSRHWGHEAHIIGQRPQQLDATIREQMGQIFLFRSSPLVAKIFAEEFADANLYGCTELQRGEFLSAKRFSPAVKCHIDVVTKIVTYRDKPCQPVTNPVTDKV